MWTMLMTPHPGGPLLPSASSSPGAFQPLEHVH